MKNSEDTPAAFDNESAAAYIATTPSVLRLSRHTGELWGVPAPTFCKPGPRKVIYFKSDLDEWLADLPRYQNTAQMQREVTK